MDEKIKELILQAFIAGHEAGHEDAIDEYWCRDTLAPESQAQMYLDQIEKEPQL